MPSDPSETAAPVRAVTGIGVSPGARALYAVATAFDTGADPGTVLFALAHRAADAVGARRAWLLAPGPDGVERVAAAWPDPMEAPPQAGVPEVIDLPLAHTAGPVGRLVLAFPGAGAFGPAERRLAAAVAHPAAGVAAAALRLAAAERRAAAAEETSALQAQLVAAVDHDLRTPLTTVLGALQTLALPEFAPSDADVAALLTSALGQARRLRALLGDLLLVSSPAGRREELTPAALRALLGEASRAGMGEGAAPDVVVPDGLAPAVVDPPALRRVLAGVLRGACRRGLAVRLEAAAWGEDLMIAVAAGGPGPLAPELSARLAAASGAVLEESADSSGNALVQVLVPGAFAAAPPA